MKKSIMNILLYLSITLGCLAVNAPSCYAVIQVFSGNFTGSYIDIPFTIDDNSEVTFEYDSLCENPDNLRFYLRVAQRVDSFDVQYSITSGIDRTSPIENIGLHKGGYIVRLTCSNVLSSPPAPEWTMNVISTPLPFAQDLEPDPEKTVDMFSTGSFTGTLGLWGSPGDIHPTAPSSQGRDYWDDYYLNMRKGSKLKFKFEWEDFRTSISQPEINFGVLVYRYKNGQTYLVHLFERVITSGGFTDEVTLLEDGLYLVGFGGTALGFNEDKKRYGGYKATVIINGEPEPYAKIDGISNITTTYWEEGEQYETDKLVNGEESHLKVLIINDSPKSINATLISFLSVRGEDPVHVGTARLLLPANIASPLSYETVIKTPANTPISLKGQLIMLLYVNTNTLLDKKDIAVEMWGPEHGVVVLIGTMLLLKQSEEAPKN